jgi:O-antigen/teichoic acid export membrane protein
VEEHLAARAAASFRPAELASRAAALLRTPLYTNAFYLWASTGVASVCGFAFWALVARLYGVDDVGLGSTSVSVLTLLGMFSQFGMGLALIRFLPGWGDRGARHINAVFTVAAAAAVLSAAVFLAGIPLWSPGLGFLRSGPAEVLALVAFAVAGTLSTVQSYAFMALRKARYIFVQTAFVQVSRLGLPALMVGSLGAFGIVTSVGVAVSAGTLLGFVLLARGMPGYRPALVIDARSVFKLVPFSLANHLADSVLLAPGLLLPLLVLGLLGSGEAGYFYIAWFLGYLLSSASAFLALSLFAEGSYDPAALRVLSRNAAAGGLAVAATGAAFLLLLGDKVLLVFGASYAAEGATLLRIVGLAAVPAVVVNVYLGALRVTRRTGELVIIAAVVAATTVTASAALLPVLGLAGAGIGYAIAQTAGVTIVLGRAMATTSGTAPQRMRALLTATGGRS